MPYEPPRWTIAPYIQRGKGTLVQADNGTGKTAFVCAIAAHVSTGRALLDIPVETPGNVLLLSVEDDLPVLRGRIEASGGDLDKCHFLTNAAGLSFTIPGTEVLFPSGREAIGRCPRCGGVVSESKKGFFCENRNCAFALWKNSRFFDAKKKKLTKEIAAALLRGKPVRLTGCVSEKTGRTYDAAVTLEDDGERTAYRLEFAKGPHT